MNGLPNICHVIDLESIPAAQPMSRTDSGFGESPRQQKDAARDRPSASGPPTCTTIKNTSTKEDDDVSKECAVEDVESITAPTLSGIDVASQPEPRRPAAPSPSGTVVLKKMRSRPSSKHSTRSSRRSSGTPARPLLSNRVRAASDYHSLPRSSVDIEDVLALHMRSCSIFQPLPVPSSAPQSPVPSRTSVDFPRLHLDTTAPHVSHDSPFAPQSPADSFSLAPNHEDQEDNDTIAPPYVPATVIHWNSPSTRRREYAEIDRSTKGLRGLIRRVTPRFISGPAPQPFYDQEKDNDHSSVRRYRLELPEEDGESKLASSAHKFARPRTARSWSCF